MGNKVFANGNEIASKSSDVKVTAAFPDVCLTPPPPPAGPLPVPYPDSSFAKDMQSGSSSVKIGDGEVMLKDHSFFKTSPLGDEAATNGQGANVITHGITGKTYFRAWSFDVKVEGENADRHLDLTTSNHQGAQPAGEAAPLPGSSTAATAPKCPPHTWEREKEKKPRTTEQKIKSLDKKGSKDIGAAYNACLAKKYQGQGKAVEVSVKFKCKECGAQQEVDLIVDGEAKECKAGNQAAKKRQVLNYKAISEQLLSGASSVAFQTAANAASEAPHVSAWGGNSAHEPCP